MLQDFYRAYGQWYVAQHASAAASKALDYAARAALPVRYLGPHLVSLRAVEKGRFDRMMRAAGQASERHRYDR